MEPWLHSGLETIYWIQKFRNPFLDLFFRTITLLGNGGFYIMAFPLIYWCFDKKLAARLGLVILLSGLINFDLKEFIGQPRPFHWDPAVQLHHASGFGLPSGHAQVTLSIGGYLFLLVRNSKFFLIMLILLLLIGLSRIYLGVHFPTDVLAGWGVGIAFLAVYWPLEKPLSRWLENQSFTIKSLLILCIPLFLYVIYPNPNAVIVSGSMIGLGYGYLLNQTTCTFERPGTKVIFWTRFLVSFLLTASILYGLRFVFPEPGMSGYVFWRFMRYLFTGIFITFLAPCLFTRWEVLFSKNRA